MELGTLERPIESYGLLCDSQSLWQFDGLLRYHLSSTCVCFQIDCGLGFLDEGMGGPLCLM